MPDDLDDRSTAYVLSVQDTFEDLRQVAGQIAGLLVLAAAGDRAITPDHTMMTLAQRRYDSSVGTIFGATAPPRCLHHHRHLTAAAMCIGRALEHARSTTGPAGMLDVDGTLRVLRRGWDELRWSAMTVPGFEIVALDQACCAHHRRPTTMEHTISAISSKRGTSNE